MASKTIGDRRMTKKKMEELVLIRKVIVIQCPSKEFKCMRPKVWKEIKSKPTPMS